MSMHQETTWTSACHARPACNRTSTRDAANKLLDFDAAIDVLLNNAGVMACPYMVGRLVTQSSALGIAYVVIFALVG